MTFLDMPENLRPATAPVSFPCLWDAPQHDRVQWNGAATNQVSPLGLILFGTDQVGALGRNSGEVLGVFGSATVNSQELLIPRPYASTINKANLLKIEESLKSLWSPLWPEDAFGKINAASRTRGEVLYQQNCIGCHNAINRTDPGRKVTAHISDEGTDQNMVRNFGAVVKTGRLKGRQKTLTGLERMAGEEPRGVILKHIVERTMLDPNLNALMTQRLLVKIEDNALDALNPGYHMQATIEIGGKKLVGDVESLIEKAKASKSKAKVKIGYKARPLNGVWATAPYLHNGSVRSLADLLKPAAERSRSTLAARNSTPSTSVSWTIPASHSLT